MFNQAAANAQREREWGSRQSDEAREEQEAQEAKESLFALLTECSAEAVTLFERKLRESGLPFEYRADQEGGVIGFIEEALGELAQ